MSTSVRYLGIVLAAGIAGSLALGLALGFAQEESVLRWSAYMLYIVGALVIGLAALAGGASPRRKAHKRLIERSHEEDDTPAVDKAMFSDRLVLAFAGAVLFAAGTLLEVSL